MRTMRRAVFGAVFGILCVAGRAQGIMLFDPSLYPQHEDCDRRLLSASIRHACFRKDIPAEHGIFPDILTVIDRARFEFPGGEVFPPADDFGGGPSALAPYFPTLGMFVQFDRETTLYFTERYREETRDGKTMFRKDVRFSLAEKTPAPFEFALTVVDKDIWNRRDRDSMRVGLFARVLPSLRIGNTLAHFRLHGGYDDRSDAYVFFALNISRAP